MSHSPAIERPQARKLSEVPPEDRATRQARRVFKDPADYTPEEKALVAELREKHRASTDAEVARLVEYNKRVVAAIRPQLKNRQKGPDKTDLHENLDTDAGYDFD